MHVKHLRLKAVLTLVPGHLIVSHLGGECRTQRLLLVYTFDSFAPFWSPMAEPSLWDRFNGGDPSPIACEHLEFESVPIRHSIASDLVAHQNPLRHDTYEVMLYIVDLMPTPPRRSLTSFVRRKLGKMPPAPVEVLRPLLFSYTLDCSGPRTVWRTGSIILARPAARRGRISFSRYGLGTEKNAVMDVVDQRHKKLPTGKPWGVSPPWLTKDVDLAPYSCAVLHLTGDAAIVAHYQ
jgi:hypothetical protein